MTAALKLVEPGIYRRGQIDYERVDAVNFSTLKHLAESPLHYRHRLDEPKDPTRAMELGTAAHIAILEPARFLREYAVFEGARRAGKDWDTFVEKHADKTIVKQNEFDTAMRMRDAVRSDPLAMRYLRKGDHEVALVWRDKETGVLCKGRLDFISTAVPDVSLDVKTTATISPWKFQGAYARLMYHLQAAFYGDGYEALTGRSLYHKCVAVESKEPHDVVVYDVIGDVVDTGRDAYRELLTKLIDCREKNTWPGHAAGAEVTLRLPAWAAAESDDLSDLGLELE